jgi:DNA-binding PadR family transcriptional regulator
LVVPARAYRFSPQTVAVLGALLIDPGEWTHGYELARQIDMKSGTLYPILVRLSDRGLVESCWEAEQPAGRPRRHLYRLTIDGLAQARAVTADAGASGRVTASKQRAARRARTLAGSEGT